MRRYRWLGKFAAMAFLAGGWTCQTACVRQFQNEVEVLFAPEANGLAFPTSIIFQLFGAQFFKIFNIQV